MKTLLVLAALAAAASGQIAWRRVDYPCDPVPFAISVMVERCPGGEVIWARSFAPPEPCVGYVNVPVNIADAPARWRVITYTLTANGPMPTSWTEWGIGCP
jgi:hypothetical protein